MELKIQDIVEDSFVLNIDTSRNIEMSTITILNILIHRQEKIHIINYTSFDIARYIKKLVIGNKNELYQEKYKDIIFVEGAKASREWLSEYTENLGQQDILFVNGINRLKFNPVNRKDVLETKIGERVLNTYLESEENWKEFIPYLEKYYGLFQERMRGIYSIIYTDIIGLQTVNVHLEVLENMSITITGDDIDNNLINKIYRIKENIKTLPLQEALKKIDLFKIELEEVNYRNLRAIAYMYAGDITKSIDELELIEGKLDNQKRVILADLLLQKGGEEAKHKCESILLRVYEEDKFTSNLFATFFRLYKDDKARLHRFVAEAVMYTPEDLGIIEANATMLAVGGDGLEAAKEFRKIAGQDNYAFYELLARINEIISDTSLKNDVIVKYIDEHVEKFPEIKNEAYLRLAKFFIEYRKSYFLAYKSLNKADISNEQSQSRNIVLLKMNILKDEIMASKALLKIKPFKKEEDAKKLASERYKVFVEAIEVLSLEPYDYLHWHGFVENQSTKTWSESVYCHIQKAMMDFIEHDVIEMYDASFVIKCESFDYEPILNSENINYVNANASAIKCVRDALHGGIVNTKFENFEDLVQAVLTVPIVSKDIETEVWGYFYLSLIATKRGLGQRANEIALTLFDMIGRINKNKKFLCQHLGLIAWGYTQYRAGRKVEGIACILVATGLGIKIQEVHAIIEIGFDIISDFLNYDCRSNFLKDIKYWRNLSEGVRHKNAYLSFISIESKEMLLINSKSDTNSKFCWIENIIYLISFFIREDKLNQAEKLLRKSEKEIREYLWYRKDISFKVMFEWACLYFRLYCIGDMNALDKSIAVSEVVILELEKFRYSYSHKEERAGLGSIALDIYSNHIMILGYLYEGNKEAPLSKYFKSEILKVVHNLLPRSILEQKKYYEDFFITKELVELHKEYNMAKLEYDEMVRKQSNPLDDMSMKVKRILEIKDQLIERHPNYAPLKQRKPINFEEVKSALHRSELCFQYIITPNGILEIFIDSENIEINFKKCEQKIIEACLEEFSYNVQSGVIKEELEKNTLDISMLFSKKLMNKVRNENICKLYVVSNMQGKLFPFTSFHDEEGYLIDYLESIINLVDYDALINKKEGFIIQGLYNKIVGKKQNYDIEQWIKYVKKIKGKTYLSDESTDDMSMLADEQVEANTIAIYGHGVSDPNESHLYGAKGIEGEKSIVSFEEIAKYIQKYENLIIISCRAGTPDYDEFDNYYGVWSSVFERFKGSIILCKWDVPTVSTVEIISELFEKCISESMKIDETLLSIQKKKRDKYSIQHWAGLEFWIN